MPLIEWNDTYKTGIWEIDIQHERWFMLTNALHEAMLSGKGSLLVSTTLAAMVDYVRTHFADEERLMRQYDYPQFHEHKGIHDAFVVTLNDLQKKHRSSHLPITREVMDTMKNWLVIHIGNSDRQFGTFLKEKGVA